MKIKPIKTEIKLLDETGRFSGYASTRKKDSYGDIVAQGAFKRTIDQKGQAFPILWMHDPAQPIGISKVLYEDEKGLYTEGQLDLSTDGGKAAYSGLQMGYIDRMSIGYRTVKEHWDNETKANVLDEIELLEYSLITKNFAANDAALVTGIKRIGRKGLDPDLIEDLIEDLSTLLLQLTGDDPGDEDASDSTKGSAEDATLRQLIQDMRASIK